MNNQPVKLKEITQVLTQLSTMLTDLNNEMDRENQAIRKRDTDLLSSATNAKIVLLQSIETSSNSLAGLMVKHGYHDAQMGLNKGALAFELGEVWLNFCDKMDTCNDKNTVNGRAIELSKASTDRVVGMLRGNEMPVYGRAGKMQDNYDIVTLAEA